LAEQLRLFRRVAEVLSLEEVFGPLWVQTQLQVTPMVVLARLKDWMVRDSVELREMV
jgi:hypothetical protein